jgi:hypothetical protein
MGFATNDTATPPLTTAYPTRVEDNPFLVTDSQKGGVRVETLGTGGRGYAETRNDGLQQQAADRKQVGFIPN